MKPQYPDLGTCNDVKMLYAGTVNFDDTDIDKGVELCELPAGIIVTKAVAKVNTAFNAATTNVLTVGANDDVNDLLGSDDVTEGTAGAYDEAKKVKAKYTQSGTAATAGSADIYLFVVRIPA